MNENRIEETAEQSSSIEDKLAELEELLKKMEEPESSLEQTFRYFEKGMQLVKDCSQTIDRVEKQIQVLTEV